MRKKIESQFCYSVSLSNTQCSLSTKRVAALGPAQYDSFPLWARYTNV
jgi:hypothetical protein